MRYHTRFGSNALFAVCGRWERTDAVRRAVIYHFGESCAPIRPPIHESSTGGGRAGRLAFVGGGGGGSSPPEINTCTGGARGIRSFIFFYPAAAYVVMSLLQRPRVEGAFPHHRSLAASHYIIYNTPCKPSPPGSQPHPLDTTARQKTQPCCSLRYIIISLYNILLYIIIYIVHGALFSYTYIYM